MLLHMYPPCIRNTPAIFVTSMSGYFHIESGHFQNPKWLYCFYRRYVDFFLNKLLILLRDLRDFLCKYMNYIFHDKVIVAQ